MQGVWTDPVLVGRFVFTLTNIYLNTEDVFKLNPQFRQYRKRLFNLNFVVQKINVINFIVI